MMSVVVDLSTRYVVCGWCNT